MSEEVDVLVVGSGVAGLSFALAAARFARVMLVTKKERPESSTNYAQGGIAAVFAPDDSPHLHAADTFVAGAGLCHRDAVEVLVTEGPARIRHLLEIGVRFSREAGELSLGREGGHSRRRIVRAEDLTGREVERALLAAVAAEPRIDLRENCVVLDLLVGGGDRPRCCGVTVLEAGDPAPSRIRARAVVLASGGTGRVYLHTTNPGIATGDGVAMAYRAGARVANLEFVQFHPTALYPTGAATFLISEAVRGEGAILRRRDGSAFMEAEHPLGSLAPRDIVARAIDREMKRTGDPYVLLDCSPIPPAEIRARFPNILRVTAERGIDMLSEPLPVVPAAHYQCGGVLTDSYGRSTLPGLLAIGEAACTGVHGANRLASNSLLEALVFAHRAANRLEAGLPTPTAPDREITRWGKAPLEEGVLVHDREEVRTLMWDLVGIVRTDERLRLARGRLGEIATQYRDLCARHAPVAELAELRNLVETALLIVRSAQSRRESRGLHYNLDYPYRDNERFLRDTLLPPAEARP
ncbi:MAG TPA: L-aspartate oxidase [Longimicrobiaceae bacterium]|nr:L-aspartate oxidase [Longimicrobiaceae bacterium]